MKILMGWNNCEIIACHTDEYESYGDQYKLMQLLFKEIDGVGLGIGNLWLWHPESRVRAINHHFIDQLKYAANISDIDDENELIGSQLRVRFDETNYQSKYAFLNTTITAREFGDLLDDPYEEIEKLRAELEAERAKPNYSGLTAEEIAANLGAAMQIMNDDDFGDDFENNYRNINTKMIT